MIDTSTDVREHYSAAGLTGHLQEISSWLRSAHPAEALAQLLCNKSRLLEGSEAALLS